MKRTKWKQVALESKKECVRLKEDLLELQRYRTAWLSILERTKKELADAKATIKELEECLGRGWAEECKGLTEIVKEQEAEIERLRDRLREETAR